MTGWRARQSRRDIRHVGGDRGTEYLVWFVGVVFAGLLVVLGVWCLVSERIPIGIRDGRLQWACGVKKDGFGLLFVAMGASVHFGALWLRIRTLRPYGIPFLVVTLLLALVGFYIAF